jgi:O-methyltransferase
LAVLHLDGDLYQSTMEAQVALYPKLMPGSCINIDDYGCVGPCQQTVKDYRRQHGITEEIETIDWTGVYWQRAGAPAESAVAAALTTWRETYREHHEASLREW